MVCCDKATSNNCCGNDCCSSNTTNTQCNGYYNTMCPSGVVWAIDVAQFSTNTQCCDDYLGHTINIHNRAFLTLTQFQQMFYSDHKNLSTANPPQCDNSFCLVASPWVCPSGNTHIANSGGLNTTQDVPNIDCYWSNGQNTTIFGPSSSAIVIPDGSGVQWCPNRTDLNQNVRNPWVHVYQLPSAQADYIGWGGRYGWVPTNLLSLDPTRSYYNYNCLGGTDNPPYFFLGYLNDVSNNGVYEPFQAQKTIMNNMVKDLDASLNCWDLCARAAIYDQLFNLCLSNEHSLNNCLELKCARSWEEVISAIPPTQTFSLNYSNVGTTNTIMFSDLPYNSTTPEEIFAGNGIVGPEAQGVWVSRIQTSNPLTNVYQDASRNYTDINTLTWPDSPWTPWTYDQSNNQQNSIIHTPWNIQPNTSYIITLITGNNSSQPGTVTWNYNIVNVGDFISMRVDAKIHNDHCKINTNTIRINYICKVDQELSNYCGTPISSNRGFKQNEQGTFYYGGSVQNTWFNTPAGEVFFLHTGAQSVVYGGGDDGGLPVGAFDCAPQPTDEIPTVTIELGGNEIQPGSGASVTIKFSEQVIGFNPTAIADGAADLTITGPAVLQAANWGTSDTPTDDNYRREWNGSFSVNNTATDGDTGTITVGTFWTDINGNSPISGASATYTVTTGQDTTPPTASMTLSNTTLQLGQQAILTIQFSEPINQSTFTIGDLTFENCAAITGLTLVANTPGPIYTLDVEAVPPSGSGKIILGTNWEDANGNNPTSTVTVQFYVAGL